MKLILLVTISAMLFSACSTHYVQLFKTHPLGQIKTENDAYVFENDTVKIVYNFWSEYGVMSFTIFNKLNVPLYVDWRKSVFIENSEKQDYWHDVETINAKSVSVGASANTNVFVPNYSVLHNGHIVEIGSIYNVGLNASESYSKAVKTRPERVTFISPQTVVGKAEFAIYNVAGVKLKKADIKLYSVAPSYNSDTSKKVVIAGKNYPQDETLLLFRNYLTLSTSENFTHEFYVDNGFYINRIAVIPKKQFIGKVNRETRNFTYPYEDSRYFYITMDGEGEDYCDDLFRRKGHRVLVSNIVTGQIIEK